MLALLEPAPDRESLPDTCGTLHEGALLDGKYRIERVIAEGGMGVLYRAWHALLERPVAIKVMRPEFARSREAVAGFLSEARAVAQLRGPHTVQLLDLGRIEKGAPYLVFELLEGADLRTVLNEKGPLPLSTAVRLALEACEALEEAHAVGVVHRDLKPENLFLSRTPSGKSVLKLVDFGIARRVGEPSAQETTTGAGSVGSPHYMSPEQMTTPQTVDTRTDIWSLGVVLFELLSNETPFAGETFPIVFARVIGGEPTPLSNFRADLPEAVQNIVWRCLAKKPGDRFATISELASALTALEAPASTEAASLDVDVDVNMSVDAELSVDVDMSDDAELSIDIDVDEPVVASLPARRARLHRAGLMAACAAAAVFYVHDLSWATEVTTNAAQVTASAVERVKSVTFQTFETFATR